MRPGEKLYEELLNDTSKSLPTYHFKIMIAQELQEEYETLHQDVSDLIHIAEGYANDAMVA